MAATFDLTPQSGAIICEPTLHDTMGTCGEYVQSLGQRSCDWDLVFARGWMHCDNKILQNRLTLYVLIFLEGT